MALPPVVDPRGRGNTVDDDAASFVSAGTRARSPTADAPGAGTGAANGNDAASVATAATTSRFRRLINAVGSVIPGLGRAPAAPQAAPGAPPAAPAPTWLDGVRDLREISGVVRELLALAGNPAQIAALRVAALGEPAAPGAAPAEPSDMRVFAEVLREALPSLTPLLDPWRLADLRAALLGDPADPDAPPAGPSDARVIVETLHAMLPTLAPLLDPTRLAALRVAAVGEPADPDAPVEPSDAKLIVGMLYEMLPDLLPLLDPTRLAALRIAALGEPVDPDALPAAPSDARVIIETLNAMLPSLLPLLDPARITALRTAALGDPATATTTTGPSDIRIVAELIPTLLPLLTELSDPARLAALRIAAVGEPAVATAPAGPSDVRIVAELIPTLLPLLTQLADPTRLTALRTAALGDPATAPAAPTGPSDTRAMVDAARELIPNLLPLLTMLADPARLAALRTAALGDPSTATTVPTGPSDTRVLADTARELIPSLLPLLTMLADPSRLAALRTAALGDTTTTAAPTGPSDTRVIVEAAREMLPSLLPLLTTLSNPTQLAALRTAALGDTTTAAASTGPSDTRVIVETVSTMLPSILPLLERLLHPAQLAALRTAALGEPTAPGAPAGPSDTRVIVEAVSRMLPSLLPLLQQLADPARLTALRTAALGDPATATTAPTGPSDTRVIAETVRDLLPSLTPLLDPTRLAALRTAALGEPTAPGAPAEPSDARVIVETIRDILPALTPLLNPANLAALRTAAFGDPVATTSASAGPSDARVIAQTAASFLPFLTDVIAHPERIAAAIETIRTAALGAPADPTAPAAPASTTFSDIRSIADTFRGVVDLTNRVLTNPEETAIAIRTVMGAISPPAPAIVPGAQPAPAGPSMLTAAAQIAGAVGSTAALVHRVLDNPAGTADALADVRTRLMGGATDPDAPSMMTSLRNWVVDGITGAAKSALLTAMEGALNAAIPELEGPHPAVAAQLRAVLETVRATHETGDLTALKERILHIINGNDAASRILQVHFDNFIPVTLRQMIEPTSPSAEARFTQNIEELRRRQAAPPDYNQGIIIQRARVVDNVGAIAAMQLTNTIFRLGIDTKTFSLMIATPHDDTFMSEVKKRFYAKIDENTDLNWFRRFLAKNCFGLVSLFSTFFLGRFITTLLDKLNGDLTNNTPQQTQEIHNAVIARANDYLSILKGVLSSERTNPAPTAAPETRVATALAKPEFNHGWKQQALYAAAGAKAVDAFLPPLGWHADFSQRIASMPIVFNYLLHAVAGSFVWITEAASNAFIRHVLKTLLNYANVVDQLVDLSESQIVQNGYTHAINKLIYEQLLLMWETIHEPVATDPTLSSEATVANKQYLRSLIINFFEVLSLNQKMQFSASNPTFIERAKEAIHKLTIDLNVDVIGLIIDQAKNEFLKPERLPMRALQILEAVNAALETTTDATPEEMTQKEQDIKHLSDMLINKAVERVVHESFHADPNQGPDNAKKFLSLLQTEVATFAREVTTCVNSNQKEEALTLLHAYQLKLRDIQRRVHADPSLANDGEVFNRFYSLPLAQQLEQLGRQIQTDAPRAAIHGQLRCMTTWAEGLTPMFTVNLALLRVPGQLFEKVTQTIAFNAGKEFLDSIFSAVRTPYNWRYGAWHHGVLLPLVETR